MLHDDQQAIRESAYRKWEAAGCPEGCELSFWLEAERELEQVQRPKPSVESPTPTRQSIAKGGAAPRVAEPPRTAAAPPRAERFHEAASGSRAAEGR